MTTEQTTLSQLTETAEYYHQPQEEAARIKMSLDIAKASETAADDFRVHGAAVIVLVV